jgi:hypothetical protein
MRISGWSRECAEKHSTAVTEVARDRNQKAASAEKGGKQFWAYEIKINGEDFRLMARPGMK